LNTKPEAIILDATAAYRGIWSKPGKTAEEILFIDIEDDLDIKPDLLMDCTETEFPDGRFRQVFFDPPHRYGHNRNTGIHQTPSKQLQKEKWGSTGSYYGFDKYKTKKELMDFVYISQQEFYRITDERGVLWVKWSEVAIKLPEIIKLFTNWKQLIKFEIAYQGRITKNRTWWLMFIKNRGAAKNQISLDKNIQKRERT